MNKQQLEQQQQIAYNSLHTALLNHRLSHAYMFSGVKGTGKKASAILLAQSIFCEEPVDGFACLKCNNCQRVLEGNYADLITIDGSSESIKKDSIMQLQEQFSKMAIETNGNKVYIIDHCENASLSALNALLKFVEDANDAQTAIFICEQTTRMLATIVSRCQVIPFKPMFNEQSYLSETEIDTLDAYFLYQIVQQQEAVHEISEQDDYQHARFVVDKCLENLLTSPWDCIYFMQSDGYVAKAKTTNKQSIIYFFDLMTIFFKDCINIPQVKNEQYLALIMNFRQKNCDFTKAIISGLESKDLLEKSVNLPLLLDQYLNNLKEVIR